MVWAVPPESDAGAELFEAKKLLAKDGTVLVMSECTDTEEFNTV